MAKAKRFWHMKYFEQALDNLGRTAFNSLKFHYKMKKSINQKLKFVVLSKTTK